MFRPTSNAAKYCPTCCEVKEQENNAKQNERRMIQRGGRKLLPKPCECCSADFTPKSHNARFCTDCFPIAKANAYKQWSKEYYQQKKETENTEPPNLADYIQEILSRKAQAGKSAYSQSLYNLKDAANMLNFLTRHKIMDMAGLDDCFGGMIGRQQDIRDKLKPIDRQLKTLDEHIKQADIYLTHKGKKAKTEAEQILFIKKLKDDLNKKWKEAAHTVQSNTPLPQPTIARKQKRRKYYIMRCKSFQAISETIRKGKDGL